MLSQVALQVIIAPFLVSLWRFCSQPVDLPACVLLQLFADVSPRGLPLTQGLRAAAPDQGLKPRVPEPSITPPAPFLPLSPYCVLL